MAGVLIRDLTRHTGNRVTGLPFAKAAKAILPGWDISLVLVGARRAQNLNHALRRRSYIPNVLSYQAGTKSGEIIICPAVATRQAKSYGLSAKNYCLLLFIHALLHLKGWAHGARMEACERTLLARLAGASDTHAFYGSAHSNRHRYRDVPGQSGRRRRGA